MKRFLIYAISLLFWVGGMAGIPHAMVIKDAAGGTAPVSHPYKRIISLYGAHTENLFALGLNREIIGVSRHEAYPPEATRKPVFSYHDDAERFLGAHPDLVLIRPMIARGYPQLIRKLRKAGITVVSLQPRSIQEMLDYWKTLGILTGRVKAADGMIHYFKEALNIISQKVSRVPENKRKRVYFESIHSRMKTFAPSSIALFALKSAGGINVAADATAVRETNIAAYGKERILSHAHEIDVFLAQRGAMNRISKRRIYEEAGFDALKAVQDRQVYIIDEMIVSRPTPRLTIGIYQIGRFLYPDIFNDVTSLAHDKSLTRARFAEMFIKMAEIPFTTPSPRHISARKKKGKHLYGDFKDVNYRWLPAAFIETAVAQGVFGDIRTRRFSPDKPVRRKDIAYSLFVGLDLPEAKPCKIKDVSTNDSYYPYISAVAGLGIMETIKGNFFPNHVVTGPQAFRFLKKALKLIKRKGNQDR